MKLHLDRLLQLSRQRLPFILIALIPVVIMEILSRGEYIEMFTWSYKHIIELLYNEWIVFSLLLLFIAIIGRTRVAIGFFQESYW